MNSSIRRYLLLAFLALAGCSVNQSSLVYKMDIPQGNLLDQSKLAQVKQNMHKSEVLKVLGSPMLIDPFHQNRWDYYYSAGERDTKIKEELVTVLFDEHDLVKSVTKNTKV